MARAEIRGFACCNELYEHVPLVEGFRAPRPIDYDAVEAFDFTPGPERLATGMLRNLRQVWGAADGRT